VEAYQEEYVWTPFSLQVSFTTVECRATPVNPRRTYTQSPNLHLHPGGSRPWTGNGIAGGLHAEALDTIDSASCRGVHSGLLLE